MDTRLRAYLGTLKRELQRGPSSESKLQLARMRRVRSAIESEFAMNTTPTEQTTRRNFIKTSAATAAIGFPAILSAAPNSNKLRVGLIGCGGRGTGAASQALTADSNVELTAMGELFEAPMKKSLEVLRQKHPDKVKVTPERCFIGFDAFEKVIANSDVVLLTTAPAFRPLHLKAAIDAGRHAFVEITLGVDAPGVRMAMEASESATKKNLGILSGFCWRYNERHRAVREQI
ncbi:MAG: twin-arginine translocation signal domain-containing protein, partial [Verrucomicrobia bacterium]|nr:twin-arginine translocation signal domain-containing protein [Verrucomicrobiota bacterium]